MISKIYIDTQTTFCYSLPCLPSSNLRLIPKQLSLASSVFSTLLFNPFAFNLLRTLLRDGRSISLFISITSALFSSRRGVYPLSPHPRTLRSAVLSLPSLYLLSFQILPHSFAFFCTHANLNSFIFNRFRTLRQKPPGVGVPLPPFSCYFLASTILPALRVAGPGRTLPSFPALRASAFSASLRYLFRSFVTQLSIGGPAILAAGDPDPVGTVDQESLLSRHC
jgi:hypothetical protein